jgi:hypothetical protein
MGLNKAEKIFNIPKTSLRRYVNRKTKTPEEAVETKSGRKPVFSSEMEKELVENLLFMETRLFGLTRQDVRKLAFQLATKNNLKNGFSQLKDITGKDWLYAFLNRHKETLSLRSPTGTSFARENGFNKTSVNDFFDLLESEVEKQHLMHIEFITSMKVV